MRSLCNVKMVYLVNKNKRINKRYVRLHYVLAVKKKYRFGLRSEPRISDLCSANFPWVYKSTEKSLDLSSMVQIQAIVVAV